MKIHAPEHQRRERKEIWCSRRLCEKIQFIYSNFNNNKLSLTTWVTVTACMSNILQLGTPYIQRQRLVFLSQHHLCPKGSKKKGWISLPHMKYSGMVRIRVLTVTVWSRASLPQMWDAQPAGVLEPCTAVAGPAHKGGLTMLSPMGHRSIFSNSLYVKTG